MSAIEQNYFVRHKELTEQGRLYFTEEDAIRIMDATGEKWIMGAVDLAEMLDKAALEYHHAKPLPNRDEIEKMKKKTENFFQALEKFARQGHPTVYRAVLPACHAIGKLDGYMSEIEKQAPNTGRKRGGPPAAARAWFIYWLFYIYWRGTGDRPTYYKDRIFDDKPMTPFFLFVRECLQFVGLSAKDTTVSRALDKTFPLMKSGYLLFVEWIVPSRD